MKEGRTPKVVTLVRRDGVHVLDTEAGMVLVVTAARREDGAQAGARRRSEPPPSGHGGSRTGLS